MQLFCALCLLTNCEKCGIIAPTVHAHYGRNFVNRQLYQIFYLFFVQNYPLTFSCICGIIIIESEGNSMKYFLAPIECKECEFKSRSILRLLIHLKREHKTTFTKRDWKFAIKHFFPFRLLVALVSIVLGLRFGSCGW